MQFKNMKSMKKTFQLFAMMLISGAITLGGYLYFVEDSQTFTAENSQSELPVVQTNFNTANTSVAPEVDFSEAAEKTIDAVVHVKNKTVTEGPVSITDFFYGRSRQREMVGFGSGVIISPDGYIVTNNHVIANATQLEVRLNNNKVYEAELIGSDPKTDIALLKIEVEEEEGLPYVVFADSDAVKIGEWVLAVGNPFNLTSTVTAGIVSAKARSFNEFDGNPQSFIQTDAAVNRGNSGGALVNINGELVGINTAITSETGSYVGYAFAVPSNVTKKVIEDILEYGNVQRAILGVQILNNNSEEAKELGVDQIQGVYVAAVEKGSGAAKGGIKEGDIIKRLDGIPVTKFSDLSGYLSTKRPQDVIDVTVLRNEKEISIAVALAKLETYDVSSLGLQVKNTNAEELSEYGVKNGVLVSKALSREIMQYGLVGVVITSINDQKINTIDDVRTIMERRSYNEPIKITFTTEAGESNTFIFR